MAKKKRKSYKPLYKEGQKITWTHGFNEEKTGTITEVVIRDGKHPWLKTKTKDGTVWVSQAVMILQEERRKENSE